MDRLAEIDAEAARLAEQAHTLLSFKDARAALAKAIVLLIAMEIHQPHPHAKAE